MAKAKEQSTGFHTVKQGDSLWNIARQYCTTTQKIRALNNLDSYSLQNGQVIKIYEPTVKPQQIDVKKNLAKNEQIGKPQPKEGKAEGAKKEQTPKPQPKDTKKYVVKKGDTVYTIAKKTNMSLEEFLNINRITPRSKIFPGQELHVE